MFQKVNFLFKIRFEYKDSMGENVSLLVPSQRILHTAIQIEVGFKDEITHILHYHTYVQYPHLNCLHYVSIKWNKSAHFNAKSALGL